MSQMGGGSGLIFPWNPESAEQVLGLYSGKLHTEGPWCRQTQGSRGDSPQGVLWLLVCIGMYPVTYCLTQVKPAEFKQTNKKLETS